MAAGRSRCARKSGSGPARPCRSLRAAPGGMAGVVERIVPIADAIRPPEIKARMEEALQRKVQ